MNNSQAVLYFRVSTDEQTESGLGMEAQRAAALAYVTRAGLSVRGLQWDEGISGATALENRPGILPALASVKRGGVLVVTKRDRLARDMYLTLQVESELKKRGVRLVSAADEGTQSNDLGAMIQRTMFDLFAQVEREMIRERTRRALAAKKARGERVGSIPYGFELAPDGTRLEVNAHEQEIISLVHELRNTGHTFRGIVAHLNTNNILSRQGKQWQLRQIQNVHSGNQVGCKSQSGGC